MKRAIVVGTRGSRLALTQTGGVVESLRAIAPEADIRTEIISTTGDRTVDLPLAAISGTGLFAREIEVALIEGRIDLAVHSMKDLPIDPPAGLAIAAVPARVSPYDALVTHAACPLEELPAGARVGTSSLRRRAQLLAYRPTLSFVDLRGNVDTRLRRVAEGDVDAAVVACAGLERLDKVSAITEVLSAEIMVPAPAQGALAIEIRAGDEELRRLLRWLADEDAEAEVAAERALLAVLGGGCRVPIGALARVSADTMTLQACVCSPGGDRVMRTVVTGPVVEAAALGMRAADILMKDGARELIATVICGTENAPPRPLTGKRVVVTRPRDQAGQLVRQFEDLGAVVFEFPTIEILPSEQPFAPDPRGYDWLVFTSANAAEALFAALAAQGHDPAGLGAQVAAIGPAAAHVSVEHGILVDVVPEDHTAEGLLVALAAREPGLRGKRVLLPRSDLARPFLPDALRQQGAEVTAWVAYRTACPDVSSGEVSALMAFAPDVVTFASSSTVSNFCRLLGPKNLAVLGRSALFASIGPETTRTATQLGLRVTIQPEEHTVSGLVQAVAAALGRREGR